MASEYYGPFITLDKKGEKRILVECLNAIYGTMVAGMLCYCKFADSLDKRGFVMNTYDPCVWNKMIKGKQCTICFHVDDCKISNENLKVIDDIITCLCQDCESIFTDGSVGWRHTEFGGN